MKRQLKHPIKAHQFIRQESLKSTLLVCGVLSVFGLMAMSCGPMTSQEEMPIPETAAIPTQKPTQIHSTQGHTNLPETATINFQKQPFLRTAFQRPVRVENRKTLLDFYFNTRTSGQKTAMVMNCSLDILKAFVANGWAPVVMLRIGSTRPFILPVSYYDNDLKIIHLQHPSEASKRRFSYEDFEKSWKVDPRNRCILITPQQLTESRVQSVLAKYLPKEAYQQIRMETR